ncbi:prolyl 4-hydroxylase subunit alpha-2-like [Mytilus californianus]|uniref:prolyl 4-hydroxylase subunit alpha-2-like n=1 Tax=Mytilus californianus TaxID=6549 RepID=UPI002247DAEE|nr:prolyl 4-hydroxylase subunit alpha-2-like [Mytilus californianus]
MNNKQAENFQIVNYGIGGEYKPHYDWFEDRYVSSRMHTGTNRILTILFYLSNVEFGGSTVFPHLNIAVPPKKGSALFFTNLDEKGHGDSLTLHAGCPVFFGSKWIANKWVHTKDQDMKFLQTVPSVWT